MRQKTRLNDNPRNLLRGCFLIAAFVGGLLLIMAQDAQALRVSLKRITFEGRDRSQVVTIINNSNEDQTYRLGWKNFRMTEDVMLQSVPEGEEVNLMVAEPYLRFAPRRVAVAPGQVQQVRVMARLSKDMPDGEYRSHLFISPEAKPAVFTPEEQRQSQEKPVVKISMLTGLSLPVFIRKGDLQVTASMSDAKLTKGADNNLDLSFVLHREGNRSLYGDLDFICDVGGKDIVAKQTLGIAVYTEVTKRNMVFKVPMPESGCPAMRIVYRAEPEDSQYKGGVIAETAVNLAN